MLQRIKPMIDQIDKRSFVTYVVVGGLSSAINYSLFSFFYGLVHFHYQLALTIGFFSGAVFNFMVNRHYTFHGHSQAAHIQLLKYLVLLVCNYVANLMLAYVGVDMIGLSPYLAVIIALCVMVCVTYFLSKHWVFVVQKEKG